MLIPAMSPVRRHLPPAGCRVGRRAHRLLQHFVRRDAERETQRAIAVIRIEPIVARAQHHARGHLHGLVARARNLEVDAVLALQRHFAVVQPPRGMHEPEGADQRFRRQAREALVLSHLLHAVCGHPTLPFL